MGRTGVEALTSRERECLRLVARDRSSGEIATALGLATGTVENHIKNARAKLGGVDRFTAARLVAQTDGTSQTLASLTLDVADRVSRPEEGTSTFQSAVDQGDDVVREERIVFDRTAIAEPVRGQPATLAGQSNDLSNLKRLMAIVLLVLLICTAALMAYPLSESAQRFANLAAPWVHRMVSFITHIT